MNKSKITMGILSALLALAVTGYGQTAFDVKVKGTCLTTNENGEIVSLKMDNKSFIQDAVTALGLTNSSDLTLVYVQNASTDPSTPGDFIEVVSKSSGTAVYTNLLFLYGGGSFPPALFSADESELAAGAQVVPLPLAGSGDSLGGATIHARALPKKTVISGTFNYTSLRSPGSGSNDAVKACSGSFNVGKPFVPKNN